MSKKYRLPIVLAGAFSAIALTMPTALATPGGIGTDITWDKTRHEYWATAYFTKGSGEVRATMVCTNDDGRTSYTVYGPWRGRNLPSDTPECADYNSHSYQARNS